MKICVVSSSKRVDQASLAAMVDACRAQLVHDFCPAWDLVPPALELVSDAGAVAPSDVVVVIADQADVPGALGYHDQLGDQVAGHVEVSPVLDNGGALLSDPADINVPTVSSVLSHELMELVCDPWCNSWADGPSIRQGSTYAIEVADPVQGFSYAGQVSGSSGDLVAVAVSDFVLPRWFDENCPDGVPTDYLGRITGPFKLGPGGYMIVRDARGSEQQVLAFRAPPEWRARKPRNSRASRRGSSR